MNIEAALRNFDNPIQSFEEDILQRRAFVQNLCRVLAAAPHEESNVFALYGEWGSGKTSMKNLLRRELEKQLKNAPLPIEFNPWAFSGQDQVLEAFFTEVGKVIESIPKGKQAAEGFKKLGAYLSFGSKAVNALHLGMDLFGIPGSKIVGLVGQHLGSGSKHAREYAKDVEAIAKVSLEQVQSDLEKALSKFGRPLLIVLDDLDRLTPEQLLLMFQVVKINASLPNVNYLLLMDKETVLRHLKVKDLGPEYLEKIVQFDFTLPYVGEGELKELLKAGFKSIMGKYPCRRA